MALKRPADTSQARGLAGTPSRGHCSSARAKVLVQRPLGGVEVAQQADEGGEDATRFGAVDVVEPLARGLTCVPVRGWRIHGGIILAGHFGMRWLITLTMKMAMLYLTYPFVPAYWIHFQGNKMAVSILSAKHFHDEDAAYAFVEARIWPQGAICPHCGGTERNSKMGGKSTRIGVYKCYDCRQPFTVKIGTIFEASHIKMYLWLQAITLIAASKKGISSNQLHRTLGITLKSAWFMSHRIREAMKG